MDGLGDNIIRVQFGRPPARGGEGAPDFKALADEWLRAEAPRLVEPENERRHIAHLEPLWRLSEEELGPRAVKEALGMLLRPTGTLGAATVNKVRATGRRIIRAAMEEERWARANPFDVVQRQRQAQPVFRHLSLAEVRAVLPHLREDRRREALTTLYMGLRTGEMLALLRRDIDLSAGTVLIRRSHARDETKTGKQRLVPLLAALRPVLEAAIAASPSDLVFPGADGGRQRHDVKMARVIQEAFRLAGIVNGWNYTCRRKGCGYVEEKKVERAPDRNCPKCDFRLWERGIPPEVRWYDLRHTCATLHREAGADPLAIQLLLGHSPKSLTDSTYTHLSMDYLRRELDKLRLE